MSGHPDIAVTAASQELCSRLLTLSGPEVKSHPQTKLPDLDPDGDTQLRHTPLAWLPGETTASEANHEVTAVPRGEQSEPRDKADMKRTWGRGTETSFKEKESRRQKGTL